MHTLFLSIRRAVVLALAAFALLALGHPGFARAADAIVVKSGDLKPYQEALRGFRDACGCNAREIKLREEEGREKVLPGNPEAIVAIGTTAFKKVRTISEIPVIHTMVMPSELDSSLQKNVSGVSMDLAPETWFAAMRDVFPQAKRIGLVYDPKHTGAFVEQAMSSARSAGIELAARKAQDPAGIVDALNDMQGAIDLLWMLPDATVVTPETVDLLLRFSFQHSVPIFTFSKKYVHMGAVASLDVDPYDMGLQAGEIAGKLSAGHTGPFRLYARRSLLFVNTTTAAKMGLLIRDEVLKKVKRVE